MSDDKLLDIYEQLKTNSIGKEKVCKYSKKSVGTILKSTMLSFTALLCMAGVVGCKENSNQINSSNSIEQVTEETPKYDFHGYDYNEIVNYSKARVKEMLDDNNYTNYEMSDNGYRCSYNYSKDDYKKLADLDESMLYGFYNLTDKKTLNEVCKALNYESFNDYLQKNNYANDSVWAFEQATELSLKMSEFSNNEVGLKK